MQWPVRSFALASALRAPFPTSGRDTPSPCTSMTGTNSFSSVVNSSSVKSARSASVSGLARDHLFADRDRWHVSVDGDELLAAQDGVFVVLQRLAIGLSLDFGSVFQRLVEGAKALDDFDRAFVADARARQECCRWSHRAAPSRQSPARAARRESLPPWLRRNQIILGRIQDADFVIHQLQHVLVAGDDIHPIRRSAALRPACRLRRRLQSPGIPG